MHSLDHNTCLNVSDQIGDENKDRIQSISFEVGYIPKQPHVDPNFESGAEPHNWANALISANLKNVTKMHVQGEEIMGGPWMLAMDPITDNAIKNVLQRNLGNKTTRKLKLTGYDGNAWKKFPQNWDVTTKQ